MADSSQTALPTPLAAESGAVTDPPSRDSGRLVLIVDDNAEVRSAVQAYFDYADDRFAGAVGAEHADVALARAWEHDPDAIVLDQRLDGALGTEVLSDLRRYCPDAKIVLYSADCDGALCDLAVRGGADACLDKTVTMIELGDALSA